MCTQLAQRQALVLYLYLFGLFAISYYTPRRKTCAQQRVSCLKCAAGLLRAVRGRLFIAADKAFRTDTFRDYGRVLGQFKLYF